MDGNVDANIHTAVSPAATGSFCGNDQAHGPQYKRQSSSFASSFHLLQKIDQIDRQIEPRTLV